MDYEAFIRSKGVRIESHGFDLPLDAISDHLFDFQKVIVQWALRRGRAAIFADTGLGKTLMQTTWAQKVVEHTGQNVLIAAPLCVAQQTVEEAAKFGITVRYCRAQEQVKDGITITNYEMLDKFDASEFIGIVLDESSILKAHDSKTRMQITDTFSETPFRLSCTATPSPNDYIELGNQSEFLGIMNQVEMLATFFTHDGGDTSKWRLKGHGKVKFWEWMATWAICIRSPADLGFDGSRYELPKLNIVEHVVQGGELDEGQLFASVAQTLSERRQAKRNSMDDRILETKNILKSMFRDSIVSSLTGRDNGNVETGICSEQEEKGGRGPGVQSKAQCPIHQRPGSAQGVHEGILQTEQREVEAKPGSTGESQCCTKAEVCPGRGVSRDSEGESEGLEQCESEREEGESNKNSVRINAGSIQHDDGWMQPSVSNLRLLGQNKQEAIPDDRSLPRNGGGSGDFMLELQSSVREVEGLGGFTTESNSLFARLPKVLIWCHLNSEQDELEDVLGEFACSVRGAMHPHEKEKEVYEWLHGEKPIMISKASILGYGLNFQHCNTMIFAGMDDSFESYYQAVRRCWRFGQKKEVTVHLIISETEGAVKANIERKQAQANDMAGQMVSYMRELTMKQISKASSNTESYNPTMAATIPAWIINNVEHA